MSEHGTFYVVVCSRQSSAGRPRRRTFSGMMQGVEAPSSNMTIWLAEAPHRSGDMHGHSHDCAFGGSETGT